MTQSQRPLFRDHAINYHLRKKQKDVLPHLIAPPVFVFLWIVLIVFLIIMALLLLRLNVFIGG
jgi:hypothetical protein